MDRVTPRGGCRARGGRGGIMAAVLLLAAALALGACGSSSGEPSGPHVTILSPADRSSVGGDVVELEVRASGVDIVKPDGDTSGRTGHYHVFIDHKVTPVGSTIPKEKGIVHSSESPIPITGLTPGYHTLTVAVGDGTHRRLDIPTASTSVLVNGPSVQATAPTEVPPGQPVMVQLTAEDVDIVKPNEDTSGKTGHFHLFVDRPPVRAGEVIPKEPGIIHTADSSVPIPDLGVGEHTIWVVVGDGTHRALKPLVADKITVTVSPTAPPPSPPASPGASPAASPGAASSPSPQGTPGAQPSPQAPVATPQTSAPPG